MSDWERQLARGKRAERDKSNEWLVRRFGGPLWRTVVRELPLSLAVAAFGYLTIGPGWAIGVFLAVMALPVFFWWRTNHQVIPRVVRDEGTDAA